MEFWGVEVKVGEPLKVTPGVNKLLHLSQASLGELNKKKDSESVHLSINVDGTKLPLGTLFTDKLPQQQFDLVFDKEFEISHNWKNGSVYFYGYKADNPFEDDEIPGEFGESEDDIPNNVTTNVEPASEPKQKKPMEHQKKVTMEEPKKSDMISDDDSMSEDDDDDEDEDDSGESDEETPKKDVVASKKRSAEPTSKTPVQEKKAKVTTTPQKTDGKKVGGHSATPHPAKKSGKSTPGEKPIKSGGAHSCNSCNRTFGDEKALESHNKAKHSGGKCWFNLIH